MYDKTHYKLKKKKKKKEVLRGKSAALNAYIREEKSTIKNLNFHLSKLGNE